MPTLIGADNFTHRETTGAVTLPATADRRLWGALNRTAGHSFDTGKTRDGRGFWKIVEDGTTATNARKNLAAGARTLVWSFYFIVDAAPSVQSLMCFTAGTTSAQIFMNTDGTIRFDIQGSGAYTFAGSKADGAVHRIDAYYNTSGATATFDVSLDGSAGTQATRVQAAADNTQICMGSFTATHTLTFWIQDLVWSNTSGDHPIGAHRVHSLNPNGDGTHNVNLDGDIHYNVGAGDVTVNGATTSYTAIDDWLTGAADTTTYVQDTAGASTEYSEHTFEDTAEATIWDVFGYVAALASSTTACFLTVRIVDSGGTTLTNILNDEDVSETSCRFWFSKIAGPGGSWDSTEVNGAKVRIGLSTDVNPDPRCSAVMLMIAVPGDPAAGLSFEVGMVPLGF